MIHPTTSPCSCAGILRAFTLTALFVGSMVLASSALAANKPAKAEDLAKMEAALPEKAPAAPKKARKVLIYGNAQGFVHSSIALGEQTVYEATYQAQFGWLTIQPDIQFLLEHTRTAKIFATRATIVF